MQSEKSAEAIVVDSNEPKKESEVSQFSEGLNIELCPDLDRNPDISG
jgi:hypothetical protein